MKTMKKVMTAMLSLIMVTALCIPVMAFADEPGKIKVTNSDVNESYSIYKVLDLSFSESAGGTKAYSYTIPSAWEDFFTTGEGSNYVEITSKGNVTAKTELETDTAEFAKAALAYAKEKGVSAVATQDGNGGALEFTGLSLGYYLLDSTMGTLCSLTSTDPEVDVTEKNTVPTIEKYVKNADGDYAKWNDANLGDTVDFKVVVNAMPGAQGYTVTDTLGDGLTYVTDTLSVKAFGSPVADADYSLTVNGQELTVTFSQENVLDTVAADTADKTIVIEYQATVNTGATIGTAGNANTAVLVYGDKSTQAATTDATTTTYVWSFDVSKVNNNDDPLAGAKFALDGYKFVATGTDNVYRIATAAEMASALDTIETDATGKFTVQGLKSDTYTMTETEAPEGYNLLTEDISIEIIGADGSVTVKNGENTGTVKVVNNAGAVLPGTGGMGTTIFYIVGGAIVLIAVVALITKRRMASRKN